MNCDAARPLLNLLTDDALGNKDTVLVQQHLSDCLECQWEWNEITWLRNRLSTFKEQLQPSPEFMSRLGKALDKEEINVYFANFSSRSVKYVAAMVIIISSVLLVPTSYKRNDTLSFASANSLIDGLSDPSRLHAVEDRSQLIKETPYSMEFIKLPNWRLTKVGLYTLANYGPIARLDFSRPYPSTFAKHGKSESSHHNCFGGGGKFGPPPEQLLSCYQVPAGLIRADKGEQKMIGNKKVRIGHHKLYQWALWSQNGLDYFLVTKMTEPDLEAVVNDA
jgi:hypothetical protein